MNYERLIDDLKLYAEQYDSGATLGRVIEETEDLMFEAAVAIERLVKAKQWTLVDDELPPNEREVLLCVEKEHAAEVVERSIIKGIYTKGARDVWRTVAEEYTLGNVLCKDYEEIDGTVIAWMPLPALPSIEEMRQK